MAIQTRQYGPFRGCMSSIDRDLVPLDRITGDSRNVITDPLTGAIKRWSGDTLVAGASNGILEAKWSSKARRIYELSSDSLTDGLPTHAVLFTNENTGEGQLAYRDTNGAGTNAVIGSDFGSGHYPYDSSAFVAEFIMPVLKARHNPTAAWQRRDYTRAIDPLQRRLMGGGSRGVVEMAGEMFFPSYSGTPFRWNRRFNDSGSTGSEVNRIRPWYNQPPAWMPRLVAHAGTAGWKALTGASATGTAFYYSVMYLMNDGSYTMPVVPREPNTRLSNGYGLFKFTADADYITWNDLPIGPDGTRARILLRSPQVAAGVTPSAEDLRICGVVFNNTSTTYVDTNASDGDLSLTKDPIKVRFDHVAPWRSRYAWVSDQRLFIGYRRPNPGAFFVTPYASPTPTAFEVQDTTPNAKVFSVSVTEDQTGAKARNFTTNYDGGVDSYDLSVYLTVQDLLDAINAVTYAVHANGAWRAQMVPGADGSAASSNLDITRCVVPSVTNGTKSVTLQAGKDFNNVQVGMRVTGTDIPAGTYVKANAGGTITLGDNAGADVAATGSHSSTLTYGWETGDQDIGQFAAYNSAYPATLYWSEAYLDSVTDPADKRRIMFTSADPGFARNAPQSFFVGNRLALPDSAGILMGGADLLSNGVMGVACGSRGIYVIHNPKAGNTGLDADIQLRVLNANRGCIAPWSICSGDGWVGYLTMDGYVVTDGVEERIISRDEFNVSTGAGEFAHEIGQCVMGAAKDSIDDCRFVAGVSQGKLYVAYRSSASFAEPNRMKAYDFSPGLAASGLAEVTLTAGEAYGWSAPCIGGDETSTYFWPSAIGFVRKANGVNRLFACNIADGATDAHVGTFDDGSYTDCATPYTSVAYLKADRFDTLSKKTVHACRMLYLKGSGAAHVTMYADTTRQQSATVMTLATASFSGAPERLRVDIPVAMKNPIDLCEMAVVADDVTNRHDVRVNMFEVDYEVLRSYQ